MCASWIQLSLPRGCGCWTLSNPPLFSCHCFWRFLHKLLCSLFLPCYFIFTFPQLRVSRFFDEDVLAFVIAPSVSDSALGISNRIHSAEPSPDPVLSPSPSPASVLAPSPYQVFSLASVSSSSSSLSSESDESNDDNSPLWLDEAYSSVFFAYESTVSLRPSSQ